MRASSPDRIARGVLSREASNPLPIAIGRFGHLVSLGLWAVLSEDRGLHIAGINFEYEELLVLFRERRAPAAVILDAAWVDAAALAGLREAAPNVGLLVLTRRHDRPVLDHDLEQGATKCLSIEASPPDIRAAVRRVAQSNRGARQVVAPRGRASQMAAIAELTEREREVLDLLARGRSRAVIALTLHITEGTVHTHVKTIYRKLGVGSRAEVLGIELPPR